MGNIKALNRIDNLREILPEDNIELRKKSPFVQPLNAPPNVSTIQKSDKTFSPVLSHPVLEAPRKDIRLDLVNLHARTERLNSKFADYFKEEVTRLENELQKLEAEKQEAVEAEAKAAQSRQTWSTLGVVAQYVTSAASIAVGFSCGGVPGGLLVGAGVVGLTSRVIQDTGFLESAVQWYTKSEELQKKITQNVEMGMFFLQLGLGLAGGIGAWKSGTLAASKLSAATMKEKIGLSLGGASQIMTAAGKFGMAHYDKKMAYLLAKTRWISTQMTLNTQTLSTESREKISDMIELGRIHTNATKKMIQDIEVHID